MTFGINIPLSLCRFDPKLLFKVDPKYTKKSDQFIKQNFFVNFFGRKLKFRHFYINALMQMYKFCDCMW